MQTANSELDCLSCGACCREAYHVVEVDPEDPFIARHLEILRLEDGRWTLPRPDGRCVCLVREEPSLYTCRLYDSRPQTCRDFEVGGENCIEARKRVGLQ